jgi:hypothetical protein
MPIVIANPGITIPSGSNPGVDLATFPFVVEALQAGGVTLTPPQRAIVPALITAASREVARFCGRPIAAGTYTEIVGPEGTRLDRGEPAVARLSYFPVIDVIRCASGRTTALLVRNTDTTTNQEAALQFTTAGDVEYFDLVYTGIKLVRTASGAVSSETVAWPASPPYMTIAQLAAAIGGLGAGWRATAQASAASRPDLSLLPVNYLVGVREPKNALGPGAALDVFSGPPPSYDIDRRTGLLRYYGCAGWGTAAGAWGDPFGASWADGAAGAWDDAPQIQVTYTAGFATIPENLQRTCAELVKASLERLGTDSLIQSESAGSYHYTVRESVATLPDWAFQVLSVYKDWQV